MLKRTLMQRQVMMSVPTSRLSPLPRQMMPLIRRSQKLKAKKLKKKEKKRKVRARMKMLRMKKKKVLKSMLVLAMRSF